MLNVTFEDETHAVINMYFGYTPMSGDYPNIGTVELDDSRWYVYFYKFPDFMREDWPEPTYVPSIEGEDILAEDVN